MMNNQHKPETLSTDGQARRAAMLEHLQEKLASHHRRRRARKHVGGTATVIAILLIAWGIGLNSKPKSDLPPEAIASETGKESVGESPTPVLPDSQIASESANPKQRNQKQVLRGKAVVLEIIDDEEMLALLSTAGHPSVLGTINGKRTLIPTSRRRNRSKSKGS